MMNSRWQKTHTPHRTSQIGLKCLKLFHFSFFIAVIFLFFQAGCSQPGDKDAMENGKMKAGDEAIVARVGNVSFTTANLEEYLAQRSFGRPLTKEFLGKALEEMLVSEALYQKAKEKGIDQDFAFRQSVQQMYGNRLLDEEVVNPVWQREIPRAEIEKFYKEHELEYSRPEQVRIADIFIAVPARADDETKQEKKALAEEILRKALSGQHVRSSFSRLIREFSDTHPAYPKGDTGFFDRQGRPVGLDSALVQAAFNLDRNGRLAEQVIASADGYHIIMRTGFKDAFHRSLDDVTGEITMRIRRAEEKERRQAFIDSVMAQAAITRNEQGIETLYQKLTKKLAGKGREGKRASVGESGSPTPPTFPGERAN